MWARTSGAAALRRRQRVRGCQMYSGELQLTVGRAPTSVSELSLLTFVLVHRCESKVADL